MSGLNLTVGQTLGAVTATFVHKWLQFDQQPYPSEKRAAEAAAAAAAGESDAGAVTRVERYTTGPASSGQ